MGAKGAGKPLQRPKKTETPPKTKVGDEPKKALTKNVSPVVSHMSFLEAAKKASAGSGGGAKKVGGLADGAVSSNASGKQERADRGRKTVCEKAKATDFHTLQAEFTKISKPKATTPSVWEVKVACRILHSEENMRSWQQKLSAKALLWHRDCKVVNFRPVMDGRRESTWIELSHPIIILSETKWNGVNETLLDSRTKTHDLSAFRFRWTSKKEKPAEDAESLWKCWDHHPVLCAADADGMIAIFTGHSRYVLGGSWNVALKTKGAAEVVIATAECLDARACNHCGAIRHIAKDCKAFWDAKRPVLKIDRYETVEFKDNHQDVTAKADGEATAKTASGCAASETGSKVDTEMGSNLGSLGTTTNTKAGAGTPGGALNMDGELARLRKHEVLPTEPSTPIDSPKKETLRTPTKKKKQKQVESDTEGFVPPPSPGKGFVEEYEMLMTEAKSLQLVWITKEVEGKRYVKFHRPRPTEIRYDWTDEQIDLYVRQVLFLGVDNDTDQRRWAINERERNRRMMKFVNGAKRCQVIECGAGGHCGPKTLAECLRRLGRKDVPDYMVIREAVKNEMDRQIAVGLGRSVYYNYLRNWKTEWWTGVEFLVAARIYNVSITLINPFPSSWSTVAEEMEYLEEAEQIVVFGGARGLHEHYRMVLPIMGEMEKDAVTLEKAWQLDTKKMEDLFAIGRKVQAPIQQTMNTRMMRKMMGSPSAWRGAGVIPRPSEQ